MTLKYLVVQGADELDETGAMALLRRAERPPDAIYVVSSCEGNILRAPGLVTLLHNVCSLFPDADLQLVHQGCIGFYAALMYFTAARIENALVICDESEPEIGQACLDLAGIGGNAVPGGLLAVAGRGFVWLARKCASMLTPLDHCLSGTRILARGHGLNGTPLLLRKLHASIMDHVSGQHTRVVSFDIASLWSRRLLSGLPPALTASWLESAETCRRHLLSLKPLYELLLYRDVLKQQPLLLLTLGGGARVGMLRLTQGYEGLTSPSVHDEREVHAVRLPITAVTYAPAALEPLHYLSDHHRGHDNLIFTAPLQPLALNPPPLVLTESLSIHVD